ncbi:hypothetical protein GGR52DRAFT_556374 [Hypoxylon sp. FL1284]|nr:hypothetical protein GGR52DRAFT_556374 [Hypoxylon sp. FL1284]
MLRPELAGSLWRRVYGWDTLSIPIRNTILYATHNTTDRLIFDCYYWPWPTEGFPPRTTSNSKITRLGRVIETKRERVMAASFRRPPCYRGLMAVAIPCGLLGASTLQPYRLCFRTIFLQVATRLTWIFYFLFFLYSRHNHYTALNGTERLHPSIVSVNRLAFAVSFDKTWFLADHFSEPWLYSRH